MARQRAGWRLVISVTALLFAITAAAAAEGPRYLIFHLDGVSTDLLGREVAAGRLPHLQAAFAGGGRIEQALSLWPGGTELIYPRMKQGTDSSAGLPAAWAAYDRATGKVSGRAETVIRLGRNLPGLARYQLSEGFGRADLTAALALQNMPEVLKRHRVVEFFWFPTDGAGHMSGEAAQLSSLRRFDAAVGRMLPRLKQDNLNLLLYSDHGMAFAPGEQDLAVIVREVARDNLAFYFYPNVYVHDTSNRAEIAAELVKQPGIDLALYREGEGVLRGVTKSGAFRLTEREERVSYVWEGSGGDPFGYGALGYQGEALTDDEWLDLTAGSRFPAAPANLAMYLRNPYSGDVVLVCNPPHRDLAVLCAEAGHMGLTRDDLLVQVWFKGPDVQPRLDGRRTLWLHRLYRELGLTVTDPVPREEQRLTLTTSGLHLRLSPADRWRFAGSLGEVPGDGTQGQLVAEYDLWSTYLTRLWVGAGVNRETGVQEPVSSLTLEGMVGACSLAWSLDRTPRTVRSSAVISWAVADHWALEWQPGAWLGASVRW